MADVWSGLQALDSWGFLAINRVLQNQVFDVLMPILSTKRYAVLPAAAAILMLGVWGGRRMWILLAVGVVAVGLSDLGTNLIKAAVHRTRPCHVIPDVHLLTGCTGSFAFPSNHASNMFALAMVAWLGFRRWGWGLGVLAAAVAYSRVYVGAHYPADALGGAIWGGAIGWACTAIAARAWPDRLGGRSKEALDGPA